MSDRYLFLKRLLTIAIASALITVVTNGAVVRAQDDGFDEEEVEVAAGVAVVRAALPIQQFDQWVFGGGNNRGNSSAKQRLESLLSLHVESLASACGLSEPQKAKLQLAGRGDIKRFFDSVQTIREKFLVMRNDQQQMNNVWQVIQPLRKKLNAGLFDEKSLFVKIRQRVLKPEQISKYELVEAERRQFRYVSSVGMAIGKIEEGMPLRDEQRRKFTTLLLEETNPPLVFGNHDYQVIMYQAAMIPDKKIKPIFDEAQWRALKLQLNQNRGMGQFLMQQKIIKPIKKGRGNLRGRIRKKRRR